MLAGHIELPSNCICTMTLATFDLQYCQPITINPSQLQLQFFAFWYKFTRRFRTVDELGIKYENSTKYKRQKKRAQNINLQSMKYTDRNSHEVGVRHHHHHHHRGLVSTNTHRTGDLTSLTTVIKLCEYKCLQKFLKRS